MIVKCDLPESLSRFGEIVILDISEINFRVIEMLDLLWHIVKLEVTVLFINRLPWRSKFLHYLSIGLVIELAVKIYI